MYSITIFISPSLKKKILHINKEIHTNGGIGQIRDLFDCKLPNGLKAFDL
jgi:hypothetical protein